MEIVKLCWVGTRTDTPEPMVTVVRDVLGLRPEPLGHELTKDPGVTRPA